MGILFLFPAKEYLLRPVEYGKSKCQSICLKAQISLPKIRNFKGKPQIKGTCVIDHNQECHQLYTILRPRLNQDIWYNLFIFVRLEIGAGSNKCVKRNSRKYIRIYRKLLSSAKGN